MARCTGPTGPRWPKNGLGVSSAEIVYGTIAVPVELFPIAPHSATDKQLAELRRAVGKYSAPANSRGPTVIGSMYGRRYRRANTCSSGTMHVDYSLTRPYRGPNVVVDRKEEAFQISISGHSDWVSIDRLKPAYLESEKPDPRKVNRIGPPARPPDTLPSAPPRRFRGESPVDRSARSPRLMNKRNRTDCTGWYWLVRLTAWVASFGQDSRHDRLESGHSDWSIPIIRLFACVRIALSTQLQIS